MVGSSKAISAHLNGCKYMSLTALVLGRPGHLVELIRWVVSTCEENQPRTTRVARVIGDMVAGGVVARACILVHALRVLVLEGHAAVCVYAEADRSLRIVRGFDQVAERFHISSYRGIVGLGEERIAARAPY